jgi:hypothetical protein
MRTQNTCDSRATDAMAHVLQRALNPRVTPRRILRRYSNDQSSEVCPQTTTARTRASVSPFAHDQFTVRHGWLARHRRELDRIPEAVVSHRGSHDAQIAFSEVTGGIMRVYLSFFARVVPLLLIMSASNATGQVAKLRESCSDAIKCDTGLQCIQLRSGKSACSTCSESEHSSMSRDVDDSCKSVGEGWSFESNRSYADSVASDGRVANGAFDVLFEQAQKCRAARVRRENKCWGEAMTSTKRR